MIVNRSNRDSALYVIINSEWGEGGLELRLKKYVGYDTKPKMHNIAEIDSPSDILVNKGNARSAETNDSASNGSNAKKKQKKKKNKK